MLDEIKAMPGDELYAIFKEALAAVGLAWNEMDKMEFSIQGTRLVFHYGRRTFIFDLAGADS